MKHLLHLIAIGVLIGNIGQADDDSKLEHRLSDTAHARLELEGAPRFIIRGLQAGSEHEATELFNITVQGTGLEKAPAILGEYKRFEKTIEFVPRYPLSHSVTYQLNLSSAALNALGIKSSRSWHFQLPSPPVTPLNHVTQVFPSSDRLPDNLLKFYIHFSGAMSRGEAYQRIRLVADNVEIEAPFLELGEELWDREQTRFTLFVHPGRIKKGLRPRNEIGPPLVEGNGYELHIDANWRDAAGRPLEAAFVKRFQVAPAFESQLNPTLWKIDMPNQQTSDPVSLTFDRSLDQAMLSRVLRVLRRDGSQVVGAVKTSDHETQWHFSPAEPWPVGTYSIEVATNLEDVCGNSIARPFEVQMQNRALEPPASHIAIEFIVK